MVIVVGIAIILAGAAGRRIGGFGFWAFVLVIGWSIRIVVGPHVEEWFESHDILIDFDGPPHMVSVEEGTVDCSTYDDDLADRSTTRIVLIDTNDYAVTVTDPNTTVVVPDGASTTIKAARGPISATVSWKRLNGAGDWTQFATCTIDGTSSRFHTIEHRNPKVNITVAVPNANIVLEER